MKTLTSILILLILSFLIACGQTAKQAEKTYTKSESIQTTQTEIQLTKEERRKQLERENRIDSFRFEIALKDAFKIAQAAFKKENFTKQYEFYPDDSSRAIHTLTIRDNLSKQIKRLIVLQKKKELF